MIISMGIDIQEIEEIKKSIDNNRRFLERVFTSEEISYCESKSNKYASYAARFAAKEAVMKALGTGWDNKVQWKQIEIINMHGKQLESYKKDEHKGEKPKSTCKELEAINKSGKPYILLSGNAFKICKDMRVENIFLSLSHSKCYTVANVIFEGYYVDDIYFY